jgi:beta-lactamase regulating signal transducer with metallopeptidase domain
MTLTDVSGWLGLLNADFCVRLTQALLHFVWQGAVIGFVVLWIGRCGVRRAANWQYGLHVTALLMMLGCLPLTFSALSRGAHPRTKPLANLRPPLPASDIMAIAVDAGPLSFGPDEAAAPGAAAPPWNDGAVLESLLSVSRDMSTRLQRWVAAAAPLAAPLYLCGVVLMMLRVALGLRGGRRLRCSAAPLKEAGLLAFVAETSRRLRLRAVPVVAWCRQVRVPVVVGIWKPIILLPAALATRLTPGQVETLLTHELAHIRRYDTLVNLLQRLVESLLFFHPAVWFVSRRISEEREKCCDDLVLRVGHPSVEYAEALLRMAELCVPGGAARTAAVLAASGSRPSEFKQRVVRILQSDSHSRVRLTRGAGVLWGGLSLSVLLVPAGLSPRSAGSRADAETQTAQHESRDDATVVHEFDRAGVVTAAASSPRGDVSATVKNILSGLRSARGDARHGPASDEVLSVYALDLLRGDVVPVCSEPQPGLTYCGSPSWIDDGLRILLDASPGQVWSRTRLHALDWDGERLNLRDLGAGNCPTASPDGAQIAFLVNPGAVPGAAAGIWLMNADGSGRRQLSTVFGVPKWSPDGQRLLVVSFQDPPQRHLTLLPLNGDRPEVVRLADHTVYSVPSWADGGTLVAIVRTEGNVQVVLIDVADPATSRVLQVLWRASHSPGVAVFNYPVYSTRTGIGAFVARNQGQLGVYAWRAGQPDSGLWLQPPQTLARIASLAMSPDGEHLLFCSAPGAHGVQTRWAASHIAATESGGNAGARTALTPSTAYLRDDVQYFPPAPSAR